jgi:hypothetical protein
MHETLLPYTFRSPDVGQVIAVAISESHSFSKTCRSEIELIAGLGVSGDAHCGATVKHRSRVAQNPLQPNLRQVHLIHSELFDELKERGFHVQPGQIGENIATRNLDLLRMPRGTQLQLGQQARIELTGLRNPCSQLDRFQPGLMQAVLDKDDAGNLVRKSGVMAIVLSGGCVRPGDIIEVYLPPLPHEKLERV